jgi:hypothetical protein
MLLSADKSLFQLTRGSERYRLIASADQSRWKIARPSRKIRPVKAREVVLVLVFSIGLSVLAQTPESSSPTSDQHSHEGTISSGIYSNEFFEFSVEVPPGWNVIDNARYQALNQKSRKQARKLSPELAKLGQGVEINAPLLLIVEAKPKQWR